jgi:Vacuolar protein 14 C-terminal Fig4p binding
MTEASIAYALDILEPAKRKLKSRNREVFAALIQLYSYNESLLDILSDVIKYMCYLQPSEFVMISFSVEIERFLRTRNAPKQETSTNKASDAGQPQSTHARDLRFVSSFVQHMNHVLLNAQETHEIRVILKDCIGQKSNSERDRQRARIFHILLHSFAHGLAASLSLCLWAGAYMTASTFLGQINPLDINLAFLLEIDRLIEMLERPLFR